MESEANLLMTEIGQRQFPPEQRPSVHFTNILRAAFVFADPQSAKSH